MLHPIDFTGYSRDKAWCVPSAVACLTGRPVAETTSRISFATGEPYDEITGVYAEQGLLLLSDYGYRHREIDVASRFNDTVCGPTLTRFWRERQGVERVMPLLIQVDNHVLCSHYDWACDNWTDKPVPLSRFPKPRRLVKRAWIIQPH